MAGDENKTREEQWAELDELAQKLGYGDVWQFLAYTPAMEGWG